MKLRLRTKQNNVAQYSDSKTPEGARHTPPGSPVPAPRTSRQSPQWPTLNRLTRRTSDMHNSKIHHDIQHIKYHEHNGQRAHYAHSRTHSGLPNLAKPKTLSPKAQGSLTIPPSTGPAYFCYLRIAMAGWRGAGPGLTRGRRSGHDPVEHIVTRPSILGEDG